MCAQCAVKAVVAEQGTRCVGGATHGHGTAFLSLTHTWSSAQEFVTCRRISESLKRVSQCNGFTMYEETKALSFLS